MRSPAVLLLAIAVSAHAETTRPKPAYSAEVVQLSEGKTVRKHVWSDGVRVKTLSADGASGSYTDSSVQAMWFYGPGVPCMHIPLGAPASMKVEKKEETLGTETVDGHPTRKVKVTSTWVDVMKQPKRAVETEWRATDLQELVLRRRSEDGKVDMQLEHVVVGMPEAKLLAFPAPPCNASELTALATAAPKAAGGHRTIRFDQGACELIAPLPISMSIPSDYAVRAQRPLGCFWGAEDDLGRMLGGGREADFTAIRRGVFWARVSENTEYDPAQKRFRSEAGTQDEWGRAYRAMGAKDVVVTSHPVGVFPSTRVTMKANGQRVYMLYLALPGTDSLAILINYRPAGSGGAADDAVWKDFVDSLQVVAR